MLGVRSTFCFPCTPWSRSRGGEWADGSGGDMSQRSRERESDDGWVEGPGPQLPALRVQGGESQWRQRAQWHGGKGGRDQEADGPADRCRVGAGYRAAPFLRWGFRFQRGWSFEGWYGPPPILPNGWGGKWKDPQEKGNGRSSGTLCTVWYEVQERVYPAPLGWGLGPLPAVREVLWSRAWMHSPLWLCGEEEEGNPGQVWPQMFHNVLLQSTLSQVVFQHWAPDVFSG